ncbi:MAG: tetratricopeptide repeat protein [Thermodesulfobacteriota bacterium]
MVGGDYRLGLSVFNPRTLVSSLLFFGLFLVVLTISGCYDGQNKKIPARENVEGIQTDLQQSSGDHSCSYFYFLWGRGAELEDDFEEAREAYEKALICDPGREYIKKRLVGVLIKMGKKEHALSCLKEMTAVNHEDTSNFFMLARLYAKMGRYQKARETYQIILDIEPENQQALLFLGTLHARHKNFEKGREILEKLVDINRQSFMGYSYLAKLYRELNMPDKAAAAYNKVLEINWSTKLAREALEFYERQGMYKEAVDIYERLLEEDSANLEFRSRLVKLYLHMNNIDKAMEALRNMRTYVVDTLQLDITVGRFLLEQQRYDEAVDHFRQMLDDERQPGVIRGFLALAYHGEGNNEKAKEILKEIPQSSRAYEDAVLMLIKIYQDEDNTGKIINLLKEAIADEESRRPSFYTALAEFYHEQGDSESGIKVYEEGIDFYPDNTEIRYNFAIFLDRMGRTAEALERMKQVLALDPDDPEALNYVGYTWADQGRNIDQALSYIKKAVSARPESGFIRDSLGWAYYRKGEYKKAVVELEKAVQLEPDDPTINEHLGDAYKKVNNPDKAFTFYRKALRLYEKADQRVTVEEKLEKL